MNTQPQQETGEGNAPRVNEHMSVCPNCQQWQYAGRNGYYDCLNECAERGFVKKIENIQLTRES